MKARLRDYADRVNKGESDFSTLAILYSEDGSGVRGGEIGFMGKGHLEPEYAAVAFNLNDPKKYRKSSRPNTATISSSSSRNAATASIRATSSFARK